MWSREMASPTENPPRVMPRIVGFCSTHSLLITLIVLLLGTASGIYAASHLGIETDMTRLISPQVGWRLSEEALDRAFPQDVDLIAAVVGAPSDALAVDAADALPQRLKGRSDRFREVRAPDGGAFLPRAGLLVLPPERVGKATAQLRQSCPRCTAPTHDRSLRGLLGFVRLAIESVSNQQATAEDIQPLLRILSSGSSAVLETLPGAPVPSLDWEAAAEYKPPGTHRRFVLAQAIPHQEAMAPAAFALAFVRAAARDLELTPDGGYRVRL